jgi:hypothetical protein
MTFVERNQEESQRDGRREAGNGERCCAATKVTLELSELSDEGTRSVETNERVSCRWEEY